MRKFLPYVVIVFLLVAGYGYWSYNKSHKETAGAKPDVVISPNELFQAFDKDENAANALYLDKIIEVEGVIKSVNETEMGASLSMDTGNDMSAIICEFESKDALKNVKTGQKVKVKGFCTGKLMDIVLVRCSL
jgi:hypothetical protein